MAYSLRLFRSLLSTAAMLFVLLAASSCTGARPGPGSNGGEDLSDLVGVDISALDKVDYQRVVTRLARATGTDYTVLKDPLADRTAGPRAVWAAGDAIVVVDGVDADWRFTSFDAEGRRRWQQELLLGSPVNLSDWQLLLERPVPVPVLRVELPDEAGRIASLTWALSAKAPVLVRAVDAGNRLASRHVTEEHPRLRIGGGELAAEDPVTVLQGLMRLSQPAAMPQRQEAGVRSRLDELAGSTNAWIAEAAAYVSILP
ncbi:MAG: hypothetical protein ACOCXA_00415 [Planctomycetota bacterium]